MSGQRATRERIGSLRECATLVEFEEVGPHLPAHIKTFSPNEAGALFGRFCRRVVAQRI